MISVEEQIIKSFVDTTGNRPEPIDFAAAGPPSAGAHLIFVGLRGGINGGMAMVVEKDLALTISAEILTRAAGREFGRDEIDIELCSNTVGEILNIALGEYFMHRKNESPVDIVSPKYGFVAEDAGILEGLPERLRFRYQGGEFDVYYRFY